MSELRAGGLAIIVNLKVQNKNNGKCVRLERLVKSGEVFVAPNGRSYRANSPCHSWIVTGDIHSALGHCGWAQIAPINLLPIDGKDFSLEDERQKDLTNG